MVQNAIKKAIVALATIPLLHLPMKGKNVSAYRKIDTTTNRNRPALPTMMAGNGWNEHWATRTPRLPRGFIYKIFCETMRALQCLA